METSISWPQQFLSTSTCIIQIYSSWIQTTLWLILNYLAPLHSWKISLIKALHPGWTQSPAFCVPGSHLLGTSREMCQNQAEKHHYKYMVTSLNSAYRSLFQHSIMFSTITVPNLSTSFKTHPSLQYFSTPPEDNILALYCIKMKPIHTKRHQLGNPQPPAITPTSLSTFGLILSSFSSSMEEGSYLLSRSNLTTHALNTTHFCLQNCH